MIQKMICYILGLLSYILLFIYDYNSIHKKNKFLQSFFIIGSLLNVSSTIYYSILVFNNKNIWMIIYLSIAILIGLGLEIYTLFFAIPFKETYVEENKERLCYTKGVYAICRHPGVLWYILLYLAIWGLMNNLLSFPFYLMMILGNILYIIYQDIYIFPKTFSNYSDYKKTTPFLIPIKKR